MVSTEETKIDLLKVALANASAITFSFIQLDKMRDDIEWWLKIGSILLAMCYTAWKWRKDYLKDKNE